ncbi:histone deacetylase, partial [bacterium]|nr:histone deacetylase [bacterium]
DTPNYPGIYDIARLSAGGAIAAAKHCLNSGEKAFSLMRPPGHHATGNQPGGFCYFNSIAIACLKVQKQAGRIAIIDFDCHHGNGTEDIMMGRQDILYVSHHQSPLYPGTGLKTINNCLNFPLHSGITPQEFLDSFRQGMRKVTEFKPDMLAISAGFDSYRLDPITNLSLEQETYREIGNIISTLQKPAFAILEGGYSSDLGECVHQFLLGLEE